MDLLRHRVAFNLASDSGLRLTETVKLIEDFKANAAKKTERFYVIYAGMFRKSKVAYYDFFTGYTIRLLKQLPRKRKSA